MNYLTGCSGWQYPEWQGIFYPEDLPKSQWFNFYTKNFNTVEINYTFYHFPTEKTLHRWKNQAPDNFFYCLKANRSITHYHRFHDTEKIISDFYKLSDVLEEKLAHILFQFPRSIKYDLNFLKSVIKQLSNKKSNVVEFRHESWWREDVIEQLRKKNIIFCNVNAPIIHEPFLPAGEIEYIRFHGNEKWYQGEYGRKFLSEWLSNAKKNHPKEIWCFFDNTANGDAIKDALLWKKLASKKKG